MNLLRSYIAIADTINRRIGRITMYAIFAMMAVLLWSTISKFGAQPSLWTLEAAQFLMITYFFLGGPYAIQLGAHVRMDLFYDNWSAKRKAAVDAVSVLCLLFYLAILLWGGLSSTAYSLGHFSGDPISYFAGLLIGTEEIGTLERSRTIWRPYLWPIKTLMCIGILLMLIQAVSELFKDILRIRGEAI